MIVCDTDFLIKISNDPLPKANVKELLERNQFVVLASVLHEIEGLEKNTKLRTARRARMTRMVITQLKQFQHLSVVEKKNQRSTIEADHDLVEFVRERPRERAIATMDRSLLSVLERNGLPYITLSKGRLLFHSLQRVTYLTKRTG